MLRQTRKPMSVFLIPVNQSKQLWHHSTPEYIWHHLPKITKTCQTGYTNHDIIHLKIAHDLIFMRFLRILFVRSRQKVMTSLALIYPPPPHLNEIPPKKGDNSVRPILLPPYLLWRTFGIQSHSAKFLNWGDQVNSVPDFAATSPLPSSDHSLAPLWMWYL